MIRKVVTVIGIRLSVFVTDFAKVDRTVKMQLP